MRLKNKLAVITAAGSGMGRAGAELFAREGAAVAVVDINAVAVTEVVDEIRRNGGTAHGIVADLSKMEDCKRFVHEAAERLGGIDILWNHAGIPGPGAIEDMDLPLYDKSVMVNLTSAVVASADAVRYMRKRGGGALLFTSSAVGLVGSGFSPTYSALKHGVLGLTKSLAQRYAPDKVRVNAVCPGPMDTPMLPQFMGRSDSPEGAAENEKKLRASIVMGRLGQPIEIAHAALWLVSDDASFVTGASLPVDGGYTCK